MEAPFVNGYGMEPQISPVSGRKAGWVSHALVPAVLFAAWPLVQAQIAPAPCVSLGGNFCSHPVGQMSGGQNVTVNAQVAGAVSAVEVLTLGVSGLDFAPGIGAMTCAGATLIAGATCTESVTFTPVYPGLRTGAVVLLDNQNNVLGATALSGTGVGGLGVLVTGNILPEAGDGASTGPILDGSAANQASLDNPTAIALDGAGNLYIADQGHNRIRKVTAATGLISTLAGNGTPAYAGDGLPSTSASVSVNAPSSVALDGASNLYIADTGNNVVRKISAVSSVISIVAGTGQQGSTGDGGPATAATLNQPQGVTIDQSGNLSIADTANHRIRRVDAATGNIATVAGDGSAGYVGDGGLATAAELNLPSAVAFDAAGNLYIADSANNVVRMVASINGVIAAGSAISTFAGTGTAGDTGDGGPATVATLSSPSGVTVDAAGNLIVADTGNSAIRKVSSASGFISTIAQNNTGVYVYNNGGPYAISLWGPTGLFLDGAGDLYFADSLNNRIREIESSFVVLDFTGTPVGQGAQSAPQSQTIEDDGNAPLDLISITAGTNAALDATATTCATGPPSLDVNGACVIGAIFAPSVAGDPLLGSVLVANSAANSPLDIELVGYATEVSATTTALASSANPSGFGQSVTFTATVSSTGSVSPTGAITFFDGATPLGLPVALNSSAQAQFTTAALAVGVHAITASYGGDSTHSASTSAPLNQTVLEATASALVSSLNPSAPGQPVTFTATVSAAGGGGVTPDGSVTFTDGAATLDSVPLNASGVAAYTTAALANGSHAITATYTGDAARQISGSVSILVRQQVLVASQVAVTSAPNPSTFGRAVTITAAVISSGTSIPTGTVNILDAGSQIGTANLSASTGVGAFITSTLAVGSHAITASYLGDANNAPSTSAPITQVVNKGVSLPQKTSTTVTAAPNPVMAGAAVTLTATVQETSGSATPAGKVTFTDTFNSATVALGSATLAASGTAVINPILAVGTHSIVATYAGNANDAASASAPLAVTVQLGTTNTVLASSADPSPAESAVIFTATLTGNNGIPAGSVSFIADGVSLGSSNLNSNGIATLSSSALAPGTHSITASYGGNATTAPSTSLATSQVVDPIPTTTVLAVSSSSGAVSLQATVAGSVGPTPTGTVVFTAGTTTLGAASLNVTGGSSLTPTLVPGTYTVVASYGGDAWHSPSASQAIAATQPPSAFSLSVTPSTLTMDTNQSATAAVTLTSTGGFSDTIALACAGLPTGVTCQFSSPSVSLAADGAATVQLTIVTGDVIAWGTPSSGLRLMGPGACLAGLILPFSLFFGCRIARPGGLRERFRKGALLLLCGVALLAGGCTTIHVNSKGPENYVIEVTGTAANSKMVKSAHVTLEITQ